MNVEDLTDEKLIAMCNEIFKWKHLLGSLSTESELRKLSDSSHIEIRKLEEAILDEANRRYKNIILLLMTERASNILLTK